MISPAQHVAIAVITLVAAAANSIAGGGTLLTFPALVGFGVPSIMANATSTVALWPGTLASMYGYRDELRGVRTLAIAFFLPSVLGGLAGGILLTVTTQRQFDHIVPWLVGFATTVFMLQTPILGALRRWSLAHPLRENPASHRPPLAILVLHFFVSIYGGYFGGGAGMIILASLGLIGLTNIHQMNGLKNYFAITFNIVAIGAFVWKGLVDWPIAATMSVGSIVGGWTGSNLAQKVPQEWIRGSVTVIGFASAIWLFTQAR
jgi:uncharacterized membrane protein YfcA